MISIATLIAAGIAPTQARIFAYPLARACARFDITRPARVAGFVAQCNVESAGFTRLEENLRYRTPEVLDRTFRAVRGLGDAAQLIAARLGEEQEQVSSVLSAYLRVMARLPQPEAIDPAAEFTKYW